MTITMDQFEAILQAVYKETNPQTDEDYALIAKAVEVAARLLPAAKVAA